MTNQNFCAKLIQRIRGRQDKKAPTTDNCQCLEASLWPCEDNGVDVGTDTTHGRFGDVSRHNCPNCERIWLFYRVEYEGFSGSGRWYRGLIPPAIAATVTPETAAQVIADSEYQVCGGSYYSSSGRIHVGPGEVDVDLMGRPVEPSVKST